MRSIMEESAYSSLGLRMNRTYRDKPKAELFTLKDFLSHNFVISNQIELKKVFIKDLKAILLKDNLFDLIQSFFDLETDLHAATEKLEIETTLINFDEFYKNLSPVLMRALLENANQANNAQALLMSIREALRISLEEELVQLEDIETSV